MELWQYAILIAAGVTGGAINDLGIEWHAQGGLLANLPLVVSEYRTARGMQLWRRHATEDHRWERGVVCGCRVLCPV